MLFLDSTILLYQYRHQTSLSPPGSQLVALELLMFPPTFQPPIYALTFVCHHAATRGRVRRLVSPRRLAVQGKKEVTGVGEKYAVERRF